MISDTYEVIVGPDKRSAHLANDGENLDQDSEQDNFDVYDDVDDEDGPDDEDGQGDEDGQDSDKGYEYKDSYNEPQADHLQDGPKQLKKYFDDAAPKANSDIESEADAKQQQEQQQKQQP